MASDPSGMNVNATATIDTTPDSRSTLFDTTANIGAVSGDNLLATNVSVRGMHWSPSNINDRYKPLITDYEDNQLGDHLTNLSGKSLYVWDGTAIVELEFDDARASSDNEITWNPDTDTDGLFRVNISSTSNPLFVTNTDNPIYIRKD